MKLSRLPFLPPVFGRLARLFWLLLPLLLAGVLFLPSCNAVKNPVLPRQVAGVSLENRPLGSQIIVIDPRNPMFSTGIEIKPGTSYLFTAVGARDADGKAYADKYESTNPSSPDGPSGRLGPLFNRVARDLSGGQPESLWRLRVLKDRDGLRAHFLTLIGVVGTWPENELESHAFIIGSGRVWNSGSLSGVLHLFVNDWRTGGKKPNFYDNNLGTLILSVTELPANAPVR